MTEEHDAQIGEALRGETVAARDKSFAARLATRRRRHRTAATAARIIAAAFGLILAGVALSTCVEFAKQALAVLSPHVDPSQGAFLAWLLFTGVGLFGAFLFREIVLLLVQGGTRTSHRR